MKHVAPRLPAAAVIGAASLWMATAGNAPLWRELSALGLLQAQDGWLLAFTLGGMLAAALFALLSLASWRRLLKPVIVVLLFLCAAGAYFMWTYRIVIDSTMAANALQTDPHEVQGLLTWNMALVLLAGAALPSWLVWRCLLYTSDAADE